MATYNDPIGGNQSSIGVQGREDLYIMKALKETAKERYFTVLADVESMPKHFGKTIKRHHYLPILDDANMTDQGIDASGLTTTRRVTITIHNPDTTSTGNGWVDKYAVGEGASAGAALTAAKADAEDIFLAIGVFDTDYATTVAALEGLATPWTITENTDVATSGNLYGSSKDVGTIVGKLPALSENGGRVNRVGNTRIEITGTIEKFGLFYDYTKESLDFDSDPKLDMHCTQELMNAGNELTEDMLQVDLLSSAGVARFGGDATIDSEITGDTNTEGDITLSTINYEDLMRLEIDLDNNRCPKQSKVITGSRNTDTKVIQSARFLYIGSEMIPTVRRMVDLHGEKAFIDVAHYAYSGGIKGDVNTINGEIGAVGGFRIVVVPEMMHWAGKGATVGAGGGTNTANAGYRETGGKYDVFPMLVVGSGSFTTIGFQTDGKTTKFKIKHVKPESDIAYSHDDPFGETGFSSLKFYYGFMVLRPECIALCKSVAEL